MAGAEHHGSHAERALAGGDDRGAARVGDDRPGEQRAGGSGAAGDGGAGGRRRGDVLCGGARQAGYRSGTRSRIWCGASTARLAALASRPGAGGKPTYDPAARARIVATAQRPPERKADGTATWSLSTLERTLRREAFPRWGRRPSGGCCRMPAVPTSRRGPGARPGRPSASARAGSCAVTDPQTEEKRG